MNLQLLNPFAHENFPERVETSIDANAQCVRFNSGSNRFAGSYLAIGRTDGRVAILDLATRAYLRFLEGHVKAVICLWCVPLRYTGLSMSAPELSFQLVSQLPVSAVRFSRLDNDYLGFGYRKPLEHCALRCAATISVSTSP